MNEAEARQIRCLCLDVDGVLTDGKLWFDSEGRIGRGFHIHDGLGIKIFRELVGEVFLISAKESGATAARAQELGIRHAVLGSTDKFADFERILRELGLTPAQAAAMGDDLPDLPVLQACGYALAPSNAVAEVRASVRYVTQRQGGGGAVREAIEHLLYMAGRWDEVRTRHGLAALQSD